jgi:serine/threonine-protein kinase
MKNLRHYLWAIPFLSFLCGYYSMSTLYTNKIIRTPSVVGMQFAQAARLLADNQLNVRILGEKEDPDLPAGTIISQNPLPNSSIKPQQSVFLVISSEPQPLKAPNFVGRSLQEIEKIAQDRSLKYKLFMRPCNYPANICFAQWPSAGSTLDTNPLIVYVATADQRPVIMPNLIGHSVPDVADFLINHEMVPQLIHQPDVPDGHICSSGCIVTDQRPLAGSLVARNGASPLNIHLQVEER